MSDSDNLVRLDVIPSDDATEIFLIDADFRLVDRGVGRQTFFVAPGIYKIKARVGTTTVEDVRVVRAKMKPVELLPVQFSSAMPLANTLNAPAKHIAAVEAASLTPTVRRGNGSAILIAIRCPAAKSEEPARGLELRTMDGEIVARADDAETVATGCATLHVAVAPGAYRLSLAADENRRVEQTLVAAKGWQTQIHALLGSGGWADLTRAAITIRRPKEGFRHDDPNLRLEEMIRAALCSGHDILSPGLRVRITVPCAPPMLALLGAHLLIGEAKAAKEKASHARDPDDVPLVDNRRDVAEVVKNLRTLLGAHPDVEAIAIGAETPPKRKYAFTAPTMLKASWRLLMKASAAKPALVPKDSFLALVAERQWGEGASLLWLSPDNDPIDRRELWQMKAAEVVSRLAAQQAAEKAEVPQTPSPPSSDWQTLAPRVLSLFTQRSRRAFPDPAEAAKAAVREQHMIDVPALRAALTDGAARKLVVKLTGIPMASIESWLDDLEKKKKGESV